MWIESPWEATASARHGSEKGFCRVPSPTDVPDVKGPYSCVTPQYGCGASIKPLPADQSDVGRSVALVAVLGVGLVLARRVRR